MKTQRRDAETQSRLISANQFIVGARFIAPFKAGEPGEQSAINGAPTSFRIRLKKEK